MKREEKMKDIASNDLESLKKGTISPEAAYRLYVVARTIHKFDSGKAKKALSNFYSTLKKHNPDLYSILIGE